MSNQQERSMETLTITREQLYTVMRQWEQDYRDGKTISVEEAREKSVDQIAQENTDNLWRELGGVLPQEAEASA